jgi:hypothetical protein
VVYAGRGCLIEKVGGRNLREDLKASWLPVEITIHFRK